MASPLREVNLPLLENNKGTDKYCMIAHDMLHYNKKN